MNALANIMRREAGRASDTKSYPRRAIVTSYDPEHYAAKVEIQPEGYETGFLPIGSPWVGPNWGMFCPPTPGDEVDVHFQEGGKNAAYISLRFYGNVSPPLSVNSGEFWLVHKSGSSITIKNDGTLDFNAISAVNVMAPAINLSDGGAIQKLLNEAAASMYNVHTHPSPDGDTGAPYQQMGATQMTRITKSE